MAVDQQVVCHENQMVVELLFYAEVLLDVIGEIGEVAESPHDYLIQLASHLWIVPTEHGKLIEDGVKRIALVLVLFVDDCYFEEKGDEVVGQGGVLVEQVIGQSQNLIFHV
jgi:hypothetical protein